MEKKTLFALVAVAVLGAATYAVLRTPEKGQRVGPPPRPIAAFKASDLIGLEVTSDKQEKTVLEKQPGTDKWRLKPGDQPADAQAVKSLTDALEKMTFGDLVSETADKQEELGVADGKSASVVAKGAGGTVLADLRIGKMVGGFTMVRAAGKNEVWQVSGLQTYLLSKDTKGWRDHTLFDFPVADAEKLTVEAGADKLVLEKEKSDKPGETKWKIAQSTGAGPKTAAQLDEAQATGALQSLATLRAADFAEDKKASEVGLEHPALTVTATVKGASHQLRIGKTQGDDVYVQVTDQATIYTVKKFTLDRLAHKPIDYRDKTLVKAPEAALASVDLASGGETITLDHSGEAWKAKKAELDDAKVKPVVGAFDNVQASGFSDERDPAVTGLGKPTGAVTLHLKDKSTVALKIGAVTKDQSDYYVQKIGSVDVYLVKKYTVERFLKKPTDLTKTPAGEAGKKTAEATKKKK